MLSVRLSFPFSDLSGVLEKISIRTEGACWYQHVADEKVKTTHVHGLLVKPIISTDSMKAWIKKEIGAVTRYQWSFAETYKDHAKNTCEVDMKCITYMSKGRLNPSACYGTITYEICEEYRKKWVEPKRASVTEKKEKEKTHWQLIEEILDASYKVPNVWSQVLEQDFDGNIVKAQGLTEPGRVILFQLMTAMLNKNKVRTSRNELERFYVTLIRHDFHSQQDMCRSILQNVFR